jgi:hypothetical protein
VSKEIVFPAMNAEGEAKLKRTLTIIGEFMGDEIKTESVIVTSAIIPDDRDDMKTVLNKIVSGLKRPPRPAKPEKTGKPE